MADTITNQTANERLIILDFCTGEVHIHPISQDCKSDMELLIDRLGHRTKDCLWMATSGDIVIHKETLK